MVKDKSALSLAKCFTIWVSAGIVTVLAWLGLGQLLHKEVSDLSRATLTIYLVQGTVFLLAVFWAGATLGINFKTTLSNYNASIKNDLKVALKYYLAYALFEVAILGVFVLIAVSLWKMDLFDMVAFNRADTVRSLRQPELTYLYNLVIGPPFKFIIYLFTTCILNPISEEIFFRRFLYVSLRHKVSFLPSLIVSSLLFSAVHLGAGAPTAFIVGLFLGWIYERHQNLQANIMVHGLINFSVTLIMIFLSIK